jgi:hypothetical protein
MKRFLDCTKMFARYLGLLKVLIEKWTSGHTALVPHSLEPETKPCPKDVGLDTCRCRSFFSKISES